MKSTSSIIPTWSRTGTTRRRITDNQEAAKKTAYQLILADVSAFESYKNSFKPIIEEQLRAITESMDDKAREAYVAVSQMKHPSSEDLEYRRAYEAIALSKNEARPAFPGLPGTTNQ